MSTDNRVQFQDCETDADGWTTSGGQLGTNTVADGAGLIFEGVASVEVQHSNNNDRTSTPEDSAGSTAWSPLDMSDMTIYLVVKDNLVETFEQSVGGNGGQQIVVGDGTDLIGYPVGGSNARGIPLRRQFNAFKLDLADVVVSPPGNEAVYAGSEAALDQAAVTIMGYGTLHSSKAAGNAVNCWIDGIYYIPNGDFALTINAGTSGTPETMADVVTDDETNGWGLVNNPLASQYQFIASTEWGNTGIVANSYFEASDEQWYWVGDNGGGQAVGDTHFPFRVASNVTDTGSFVLTSVVIVNTSTRAQFDLSNTDVDIIKLSNVTFTDVGTITLQEQDAGNKFLDSCVFNNCDKAIVSSTDLDDCIFNGTTDPSGAILLDVDADATPATMTNLTFNSDDTGHGVHVSPTGTGPFAYDFDNWKFNDYAGDGGSAADRAVFINPTDTGSDITLNILNGGDTPSTDTTGYLGVLTINNAVTVSVQGLTEGSSAKVTADETVGTITKGDTIFELLAGSDGVAELTTFNYESAFDPGGLDVIVRARNQGFPSAAIADDDDVGQTDETTNSNSTTVDDMTLFPTSPAVNDAYYFGHNEEFSQLKLEISQLGVGTWTLSWGYWDGESWASFDGFVDSSSGLTVGTVANVSWTIPGDWTERNINGQGPFFFMRFLISSFTSQSTVPLGRNCKLDVTRYLPFSQNRIIDSDGLTVVANWTEDAIATF